MNNISEKGIYILVTPKANNDLKEFRVALCDNINNVITNRIAIIDNKHYDVANLYRVIYFGNSTVHIEKGDAFTQALLLENSLHQKYPNNRKGIRFIRSSLVFPDLSVDEAYRMCNQLL